jgi:hypothetical protein
VAERGLLLKKIKNSKFVWTLQADDLSILCILRAQSVKKLYRPRTIQSASTTVRLAQRLTSSRVQAAASASERASVCGHSIAPHCSPILSLRSEDPPEYVSPAPFAQVHFCPMHYDFRTKVNTARRFVCENKPPCRIPPRSNSFAQVSPHRTAIYVNSVYLFGVSSLNYRTESAHLVTFLRFFLLTIGTIFPLQFLLQSRTAAVLRCSLNVSHFS